VAFSAAEADNHACSQSVALKPERVRLQQLVELGGWPSDCVTARRSCFVVRGTDDAMVRSE